MNATRGPFRRLRRLGRHPSRIELRAAMREAYLTAFALPAIPGVLIGLLLGWELRVTLPALAALLLVSLLLAALSAWLAARGRAQEDSPLAGAVRMSLQLASAPAVPFLIGCALLGQPLAWLALWGLAALLLLAGFAWLRP